MFFFLLIVGIVFDPIQSGSTALWMASQNGHLDVVGRLLQCKEIQVNLQAKVKSNCFVVVSIKIFQTIGHMCFFF